MARCPVHLLSAPLLLLVACASNGSQESPQALARTRALIAAEPADWPDHWRRVQALGKDAVPGLIKALREQPDGPGAQAGVHLLGELDDDAARSFLLATLQGGLQGGTSLAAEAALALGRMRDTTSAKTLDAVARSHATPITTRVAAAAALVDLGMAPSIVGLLEAVFLAASPNAAGSTREHGLPAQKTRWAHERYLLIEALRRRYGQTFGLDEDASWPALATGAKQLRASLAKQR